MKRYTRSGGFTIVETLIFLVVSSALLISFLILIQGSAQKNEFSTSLNDLQSQISAVIDNVATGYYNKTGNFTCTANGVNGPVITSPGASALGTNAGSGHGVGCIFIGRAVMFAPAGTGLAQYNTYDLVGQRQVTSGADLVEASTLALTMPTAIAPSDSAPASPTTMQATHLENGMTIAGMRYRDSSGVMQDTGMFAVISDLPTTSGSGGLEPGAKSAQLYAVDISGADTSKVPLSPATIQAGFDADTSYVLDWMKTKLVATKEIDLCFRSGGTRQYYLMLIGGNDDTHQVTVTGTKWGVDTPLNGSFVGGCG